LAWFSIMKRRLILKMVSKAVDSKR
jgi:hypothetical protein